MIMNTETPDFRLPEPDEKMQSEMDRQKQVIDMMGDEMLDVDAEYHARVMAKVRANTGMPS